MIFTPFRKRERERERERRGEEVRPKLDNIGAYKSRYFIVRV